MKKFRDYEGIVLATVFAIGIIGGIYALIHSIRVS